MTASIRQAWANLRSGRLQALLVFMTVLAAATLLTVAATSFGSAGGAYERLHDRVDGAHLLLDLDAERVDDLDVPSLLADVPGISATTGERPTARTRLRVGAQHQWLQLRDWPDEVATVGRTAVVDGRPPHPGERGALALDRNLADHLGVGLGDRVDVLSEEGWAPLEVTALTVAADMCPAPMCTPVVSHVGSGGLAALGLVPGTATGIESLAVGVRLEDPLAHDAVLAEIEQVLPAGAIVSALDHIWLGETADRMQRIQSVFLAAFGLVATLAAGFLIANAIGQAIRGQTRQIGLLKAVGFTRRQLAGTYLVQELGLALVASLAGVALGAALSAATLRGVAARFGERAGSLPWWVLLGVPAVVVMVAALFTLLPVRRATRVDVITAVRTGAAGVRRRPASLVHAPVTLATALVDLRSQPARTTLTAAGLALAALTLAFASVVVSTLDRLAIDPQGGLIAAADLTLERPETMTDDELRAVLAAEPDVVAVRTQRWLSWSFEGEPSTQGAFAVGGDLDGFDEPMLDGRAPERAGEAMLGYGTAAEHDLTVGDRLTIEVAGQRVELDVTGVYRQLHLGLVAHADTFARLDPRAQPSEYQLLIAAHAEPERVAASLAAASGGVVQAERAQSFVQPILDGLPRVMLVLVSVLAGIALLGVLNSVWMSVQERTRDLGLLKAVGMSTPQVVTSILAGAAAVAIAGYLVGLPVGVAVTRRLLDILGRGLGFGPIPAHADATALALILPLLLIVAVLGALVPARRAARLAVADALRTD